MNIPILKADDNTKAAQRTESDNATTRPVSVFLGRNLIYLRLTLLVGVVGLIRVTAYVHGPFLNPSRLYNNRSSICKSVNNRRKVSEKSRREDGTFWRVFKRSAFCRLVVTEIERTEDARRPRVLVNLRTIAWLLVGDDCVKH